MPINLELTDEGRVLKLDIVSPWDLNELLQMYTAAKHYFDDSPCNIDTLVDIAKMGSIPTGVLRARQSPFLSHPKSGYQIIVGANAYAKAMADTLFRITNYKRVRFFTTLSSKGISRVDSDECRRVIYRESPGYEFIPKTTTSVLCCGLISRKVPFALVINCTNGVSPVPITLEILDEGRLLKLDIVSPWNLNDLNQLFPAIEQHLDNSTSRVNTLVDISKGVNSSRRVTSAQQSAFIASKERLSVHRWRKYIRAKNDRHAIPLNPK